MKDTGGAAFPINTQGENALYALPTELGMTLRDYFVGQALIILSKPFLTGDGTPKAMAQLAYALADALIIERSKE